MSKKTKPEAEEQEQVKTEAPAEETAKAEAKPATDWEAKYNDLNDRYLRMAAEYDNFRKRSQREREQAYTDAVSRAVTALLPTYDNLERALKAETADTEYKKGVELTMTQLTESLKGINVTVIDAAAGQKTQQALVLLRVQVSFYAAFVGNLLGNGRVHGGSLEIPLTFLQLHRAGLVAVNDAPLTFAGGRYQHLFNNFG